jgi:hypothetical protein
MSQNKMLEAADRKVFTTIFKDGLVDIFLAAFILMFAVAPLLSVTMGDFWSSFVFLPFWGVVYLILRYLRKHVVEPRLGGVEWGVMRKKKLRKGGIIILVINVIFLIFGIVAFTLPLSDPLFNSLRFGMMMLILFSAAGYFLDYTALFYWGLLLALALPIGEWLYQNAGFSHHGFPVVFGTVAGIIFVRGLVKFTTFVKDTPDPSEQQMEF